MIEASLHGRLGGDPVERATRTGKSMMTASIAVSVGRPGEPEVTEWVNLVAFGKAGELLVRHQKGDVVAVMGTLTRSTFTRRDGEERTSWSLTVESIASARTVRPGGRRQPSGQPAARREPPGRAIPDDAVADLYAGGFVR
jgi:single-strand DNA-binding protein